ncbi:MAG: ATP-dependent DNA helicase RecG [Burkholderiales bacterium]
MTPPETAVRAARAKPPTQRRSASTATPVAAADDGAATTELPGVAPALRARLRQLGIRGLSDALLHLPLRYEDETRLQPIGEAREGGSVLVEGEVVATEVVFRPRRQLVSRVQDATGVLCLRFLNFYPSQVKQLAPGVRVRCFGEMRPGFFGAEMIHPRYRVVAEGTPLPSGLTPVYPAAAGVSQDALRRLVRESLARCDLSDTLPAALRTRLALVPFDDAVRLLHSPPPATAQASLEARSHPAWRRVKFDELLAQQLSLRRARQQREAMRAPPLPPRGSLAAKLIAALPFALTGAQQRTVDDVARDLARPVPMQRLLQGDVGSGKTIVAAIAALQAIENGRQVAVMAPTEILAEQHYRKFAEWLAPLGVNVVWLAGSLRAPARRAAIAAIESGECAVAVGTHALFQEAVTFARLGLAIVDEQHRFGVQQRLDLRKKGEQRAGLQPHQLMMSATPIPRTLAMSYYADLDVSVIDELPPGRTPVVTKLVDERKRDAVITRVRDACVAGGQAYWVCPLIEQSEALQLKTALETFEWVRQAFPEVRVGLVHGRLPPAEKAAVMDAFQRNAVQLLVATTVIEVGVDVSNATLMVIEHAERMGLAQLHQLRGRVGRGTAAGVCILLYQGPLSPQARERMKIVYEQSDGFEIARRDLALRGPGEFLGARQSGLPLLRFADLDADADLVAAARDVADALLRHHPELAERHLDRWFPGRHDYLKA